MIVDDDEALVSSLGAGLSDEGFTILSAANGKDAVERLKCENPDLVLLDLMLPGMDGISVCRMIRRVSQIPVIMLTARMMRWTKSSGLRSARTIT